jgi:hypothetical protein
MHSFIGVKPMPLWDRNQPQWTITWWDVSDDLSPEAIVSALTEPGFDADTSSVGPIRWWPFEEQSRIEWKRKFARSVLPNRLKIDWSRCPYAWYEYNACDAWAATQKSLPLPALVVRLTYEDGSIEYFGVGTFAPLPMTLPDGRVIQTAEMPHIPWIRPME